MHIQCDDNSTNRCLQYLNFNEAFRNLIIDIIFRNFVKLFKPEMTIRATCTVKAVLRDRNRDRDMTNNYTFKSSEPHQCS